MNCVNCGHKMIWQNDFSYEDYGIDEEDGIVSVYICPHCETYSENYIPLRETVNKPIS